MSGNIRLFVLFVVSVSGCFLHQPAMGQGVAPVAGPRSNQGAVSEQMEQGLVRPDSGVMSPIDNIMGSGIRLPPQLGAPSETPVEPPAATPEKVVPVTGDSYGK
jgi:hypothetical protein